MPVYFPDAKHRVATKNYDNTTRREILRVAQNDKRKHILCHAEQSEASMEVKILRVAQNDKKR